MNYLTPSTIPPLPLADWIELKEFCAEDADRFEVLGKSLARRKIHYEIIPIGGSRHIALPPPHTSTMDEQYFRVTFVAHYDRMPGTPGANDNAAAVFQLLHHWEVISRLGWHHRTQIIFTDNEELTGKMTATDQGSWLLAKHLKRIGVKNILFFVLDMCGIGDTPVWGRSIRKAGLLPACSQMSRSYQAMEKFLKRFTRGDNFGMNPMFSDDLGLLLGGYPAVQLSLLPRKEAEELARIYGDRLHDANPEVPARVREEIAADLPFSWQNNHSPDDRPENLDPRAFNLMSRLLRGLTRYSFPT